MSSLALILWHYVVSSIGLVKNKIGPSDKYWPIFVIFHIFVAYCFLALFGYTFWNHTSAFLALLVSAFFLSIPFLGDYLVTIEEKNGATYLRAYTNWRYQAAEKKRVGVRLLGHLMRGPVLHGTPKEQMEIVEIPLSETPLCTACCSITGALLVACAKSLVLFGLKRQSLSDQVDALDFERLLILYFSGWSPLQVALCGVYVALQTELEVLVVKLENLERRRTSNEEHTQLPGDELAAAGVTDNIGRLCFVYSLLLM